MEFLNANICDKWNTQEEKFDDEPIKRIIEKLLPFLRPRN